MQVQINVNQQVALGLFGLCLIAIALFIAVFVPLEPNFVQVLLAVLAIFAGGGGVICMIAATVMYFSEE